VNPDVVGERREGPRVNALKERRESDFAACLGGDHGSVLAHDIVLALAHDIEVSVVGNDVVLVGVLREIAKFAREPDKVSANLHGARQELEPFRADQLIRLSVTSSSRQSRTSVAGDAARSKANRSSSGRSATQFFPLHSASRIAPV